MNIYNGTPEVKQYLEPLLGQATHVQPGLPHKRDLEFLLEVLLFLGYLLQGVLHQVRPEIIWWSIRVRHLKYS